MAVLAIFRIRRDTAANWSAVNPVLALGEPGLETDTRRVKYGDGVTAWSALLYSSAATAWGAIGGSLADQADLKTQLDAKQPLDADLTAIAALTTTNFGRGLLTAPDASSLRTTAGLGSLATQDANAVAITGGTAVGLSSLGVGNSAPSDLIHLQGATFPRIRLERTGVGNWALGNPSTGGTSNTFSISLNGASIINVTTGGALHPQGDNTQSLGLSSNRWSTVFAGTGTINTSDEREKSWIGPMSEAHLRAARRIAAEIGVFQWLSALALKGDAARIHVGVRAQRIAQIMVDEGLEEPFTDSVPSFRHGFLCYDAWDSVYEMARCRDGEQLRRRKVRAAGDRFGVRPDELTLFLIAAQERRLEQIEAQVAQLSPAG